MRAYVDDTCTACGLCEDTCPEVFQLGERDIAEVVADPVPPEQEAAAQEAADGCPVDAIRIEK
jgi:ferredoxin